MGRHSYVIEIFDNGAIWISRYAGKTIEKVNLMKFLLLLPLAGETNFQSG